MKQLFRCEYCTETGTEDEIREHEEACLWNYNKRTCYTCKHADRKVMKFTCNADRVIEEGKYIEGCGSWEYDEKNHATKNVFGDIFGGFHI